MAVTTTQPSPEATMATEPIPSPVLGHALRPGIVLLAARGGAGAGEPRADDRALALLGCRDGAELAARWPAIRQRLAAGGLRLEVENPAGTAAAPAAPGPGGASEAPGAAGTFGAPGLSDVELPPDLAGGRRVRVTPVFMDRAAAAAPAALLLQDAELASALESDLRAAAQMRSLAQITPAVAHDLRAPINAMVLNLEVLKETLAPPPPGPVHPASSPYGPPPGPAQRPGSAGRDPRERQQRYLAVLREELARLHQSLELFLAHVSPRGERQETLDWRGPAQDLAALLRPPARKQQAQVELLLPDAAVPIVTQRYLLRQALLHFGLAILERVPRDGTLEIRLERLPARARLRIAAGARPGMAAARQAVAVPAGAPATPAPAAPAGAPTAAAAPAAGSAPSAASAASAAAAPTAPAMPAPPTAAAAPAAALRPPPPAPRFSAAGTDAREQVAHAIVAAFGGTSWPADPDGDLAFEIEFPLAESH